MALNEWEDVKTSAPQNLQALLRILADNGVFILPISGAPTNGTSGSYAQSGVVGPGSELVDIAGTNGIFQYLNINTAASPTWSPQSGPAVGLYARIPITSAQLKTLNSVPTTIIAAPGSGKAINVNAIVMEVIRTATAYASGGAISFPYHGGSAAHTGTIPATVLTTSGAATTYTQLGPTAGANGTAITANTGLDITCATGDFTTGTGTAIIHVWYSIITG